MMKGLFQKNLIHPTLHENSETEDLESQTKYCKVPILIPIRNELDSFERRLNNNELYSPGETGWRDLIIRRHYRNSEVPAQNETCKFEVLNSSGSLVYQISEKTEFFIKDTGCCFAPHCKEFILTSISGGDEGVKLIVEVGRTGFCNKIIATHHKRRLGSVSRKCSAIPNSYKYSVRDSHDSEIVCVNSKNCFKSNILCLRECQEFNIFMGKLRFPKGKVVRDSDGFAMTFFYGDDSLTRLLLIGCIVLMDLQTSSRGRTGLWQCDVFSCFLQLMASIFFYVMVLGLIVLIFYGFIIR